MMPKKQCFVLMPFGNTHNLPEVWEDVIRNGVFAPGRLGAHYMCRRGDDIFDNQAIIDDIVREIEKSDLVLAELTTRNPNVFYELGRAHALGKECILLVQNVEDVPFDLRHLRVIAYETTRRGLERLEQTLEKTINGIEERRQSPNFEAQASRLTPLQQNALRDPNIAPVMRRLWWMDTERDDMARRLTDVPPEVRTRIAGLPGSLTRLHVDWAHLVGLPLDLSNFSFTDERHGWKGASTQISYDAHFGGDFGELRSCFNSERFGFFVPVPMSAWSDPSTIRASSLPSGYDGAVQAWERAWAYEKPIDETEMEQEYERLRDGEPGVLRADGTVGYAVARPGCAYLLRSVWRYGTSLVLISIEQLLDDSSVILRWKLLEKRVVERAA